MERERQRFQATAEDGTVYTIIEYIAVVHTGHMGSKAKGEPTEIDGKLPRYETTEGYAVNPVDEHTFEIVPLGVMVSIS